jgi:hypothetical protein
MSSWLGKNIHWLMFYSLHWSLGNLIYLSFEKSKERTVYFVGFKLLEAIQSLVGLLVRGLDWRNGTGISKKDLRLTKLSKTLSFKGMRRWLC